MSSSQPLVHRNYQGGDIVLPGDKTKVIKFAETPELQKCLGHTLITTDGTTLLGGDDKAGVAVIMTAAAELLRKQKRQGYIVGGAEARLVADRLEADKIPLVYQPRNRFRAPGSNIGRNPDALGDPPCDFTELSEVLVALASPAGPRCAQRVTKHQAALAGFWTLRFRLAQQLYGHVWTSSGGISTRALRTNHREMGERDI